MTRGTLPALILVAISATGCSLLCRASEPAGAAFLFKHRKVTGPAGEFTAVTSDREVLRAVRSQLDLPEDERRLHINGQIARENGGHNVNWRWHFVPNNWSLAEMSMELCDGTPQMVEDDLDTWVDTVKRFCPWQSYVVKELPAR